MWVVVLLKVVAILWAIWILVILNFDIGETEGSVSQLNLLDRSGLHSSQSTQTGQCTGTIQVSVCLRILLSSVVISHLGDQYEITRTCFIQQCGMFMSERDGTIIVTRSVSCYFKYRICSQCFDEIWGRRIAGWIFLRRCLRSTAAEKPFCTEKFARRPIFWKTKSMAHGISRPLGHWFLSTRFLSVSLKDVKHKSLLLQDLPAGSQQVLYGSKGMGTVLPSCLVLWKGVARKLASRNFQAAIAPWSGFWQIRNGCTGRWVANPEGAHDSHDVF